MKTSTLRKSLKLFSLLLPGLVLSLALAPFPVSAKTITLKAVFKYLAPDGTEKPVRWALCELRDEDEFHDELVARSATDEAGAVSFEYDSEMDDGLFGGRIDPFVVCISSLMVPLRGQAVNKVNVVYTELTREIGYEASTEHWGNNNEDRTAGAGGATKKANWASTIRPSSKPPSASARSTSTIVLRPPQRQPDPDRRRLRAYLILIRSRGLVRIAL